MRAASELLEEIRRAGAPPRHVAVIMDGNGRWAHQRGRGREFGHRAGILAARSVVQAAIDAGVGVLTLFAFSEENWQRPHGEVAALMTALELNLRRDRRAELGTKGVSLRVLGDLSRLPPRQQAAISRLVDGTQKGTELQLNLAISYGARAEIVRAARCLAERVERGTLTAGEIDESLFAQNLYTADLPDPDLLIRTSGEQRISNFMLWQIAYTELHVSPVLWPDFRAAHFLEAIHDYQRRERRFGRVAEPSVPTP